MARGSAGTAAKPSKTSAAGLSIASNATLIALKLAAGALTGSVAILSEAMQSSIDLIASVIAFFAVRQADRPPDPEHPFGHEKIENLAAAIEGMLILVGAGVVIFESVRRLAGGDLEVDALGVGIGVIALTVVVNLVVSGVLARRARATGSPALEGDAAHLRTDAVTSVGVLVGLTLVELTGAAWLDPVIALLVTGAIVVAGARILLRSTGVLVDEALPGEELDAIRATVQRFGGRGVAGFHKLRARRAGSQRFVDLHVQFRSGTTLEDAHAVAEELEEAIRRTLHGGDVLIHLEPEGDVVPGTEVPPPRDRAR